MIVGDGISISGGQRLTVNHGVASTLGTASFSAGNSLAASVTLAVGTNEDIIYTNNGTVSTAGLTLERHRLPARAA